MRYAIFVIILLIIPLAGYPATIEVPKDYSTIQRGIDAALNNDTVLVAPGTYVENIDFKGKTINVVSEQGAHVTCIDGGNRKTVVTFQSGEGVQSRLEGFTVANGLGGGSWPNYIGGGINCTNHSSPTITNNILTNNSSPSAGGAIACTNYSDAIITHNTIVGNTAGDGGGIGADDCFLTILNNVIIDNHATSYGGGGIYAYYVGATVRNNVIKWNTAASRGGGMAILEATHTPYPIWEIRNNIIAGNSAGNKGGAINIQCSFPAPGHKIINNTITGNIAKLGGGLALCLSAYPVITNSILWGNSAPEIQIDSGGGNPTVTYSNIMGGWPGNGNIDKDPLFYNASGHDFHLTFNSPCRDSGDNSIITELYDFEGDPRIADGAVDMGADEFHTHLYYTGDATPGGNISLNFIDTPNTSPVVFWLGSGVLQNPISLPPYGDWYLQFPILIQAQLGSISGPDGVLSLPCTIPSNLPPVNLPLQAGIGVKLTNLLELKIQ